MEIENKLAEFINKYKSHIEYPNRSMGAKVLEDALELIRDLSAQNLSLEQKLNDNFLQINNINNQLNIEKNNNIKIKEDFNEILNDVIVCSLKKLNSKDQEEFLIQIGKLKEKFNI